MTNKANAMIVAAQPEAAEAGAKVLMRGGNAVDAGGRGQVCQRTIVP